MSTSAGMPEALLHLRRDGRRVDDDAREIVGLLCVLVEHGIRGDRLDLAENGRQAPRREGGEADLGRLLRADIVDVERRDTGRHDELVSGGHELGDAKAFDDVDFELMAAKAEEAGTTPSSISARRR